MAGYTRQSSFTNGSVIDATDFENEYNALQDAFNGSTGHTHDGTAGNGPPIESLGPSADLVVTSSVVRPKTTNVLDIGTPTVQFKNGYFDGQLNTDTLLVDETSEFTGDITATADVSIGGNLTVAGNTVLGDAATDTVNFNADVDSNIKPETTGTYNLGSSSQEWNNLWLDGTANVDNLTVDENGTVAGTFGIGGDFDINTNKVTIAAATGNTLIAGTLGVADVVSVTDTTGSTSTSTGAVVVSGGVGIAENIYVGGDADITGALDVTTLGVTGNTTVENITVNGNTTIGSAATDTVTFTADVASDLIPDITSTYTIGDSSNYWLHGYIDAITTTGNVGVGGDVTITGDLTVQGTTTTVNSTTVDIADLNITVASNAATAAAANGGGLTVGGAGATLTYDSTTDRWDMNKDLEVANVYATSFTGSITGNASTASTLATARTISLGGDLSGSTTFDGSANTTITADINSNTIGAGELNVSGNGTTSQYLRSDGDGTFTWATPPDTNTTYSAGNGLGLSGTSFYMTGSFSGNFTATGNVTAYSDERLKSDIVTIPDALEKVKALRGVNFTKDGEASTGVIAQEVQQVIPEVVQENDEYLSVAYGNLVGVLIEAVKELSAEVEALKAK